MSSNLQPNLQPNLQQIDTNDCFDQKTIMEGLYLLSHLVVASLLVAMLKNTNPMILFVILALMLAYISYDSSEKFPIYFLYSIGAVMYIIDFAVAISYSPENLNRTTVNVIYKTIWKLPYYGILSYYIAICAIYFKNYKS